MTGALLIHVIIASTSCIHAIAASGNNVQRAIILHNQAIELIETDRQRGISLFEQSFAYSNRAVTAYALAYYLNFINKNQRAEYYANQVIALDNGTRADLVEGARLILQAIKGSGPAIAYGSADGNSVPYPNTVDINRFFLKRLSEETEPAICPNQYHMSGVICRGKYCDNKYLLCQRSKYNTPHSNVSWSPWFSEEAPNNHFVSHDGVVIGIRCQGAYCDNMSLATMPIPASTVRACYWTPFFSEEQGFMECNPGYVVSGLQCNGGYCDNIALNCCPE